MLPSLVWAVLAARALAFMLDPYRVKWEEAHMPPDTARGLLLASDAQAHYHMFSVAGVDGPEQYLCEIPQVNSSAVATAAPLTETPESTILEKALGIVADTFAGKECLFAYELRQKYWSYAFCAADKIIQWHEGAPPHERHKRNVATAPNEVFVLGRFSPASADKVLFKNQAPPLYWAHFTAALARTATLSTETIDTFDHRLPQKIVLQFVTDGLHCQVTGNPRSVEVVYKCDADGGSHPQITNVLEVRLCHYKLFVHVPGLCRYEPFAVSRQIEDSMVDLTCRKVGSASSWHHFADNVDNAVVRRLDSRFPVRADNRINIADHDLVPLNRGFYLARSRTPFNSSSEYVRERSYLLFNGHHDSLLDLTTQVAQCILRSIGVLLLAPTPDGSEVLLDWLHSFLLWFEVYNPAGRFIALAHLRREASSPKSVIYAAAIDPKTGLTAKGDVYPLPSFERPQYEAPANMWNYELFSALGLPQAAKGPSDPSAQWAIVAYNKGLLANSSVLLEVLDQASGAIYRAWHHDQYSYIVEIPDGGTLLHFKLAAMLPDQKFVGVELRYSDALENAKTQQETQQKTQQKTPEHKTEPTQKPRATEATRENKQGKPQVSSAPDKSQDKPDSQQKLQQKTDTLVSEKQLQNSDTPLSPRLAESAAKSSAPNPKSTGTLSETNTRSGNTPSSSASSGTPASAPSKNPQPAVHDEL